MPIIGFEDDHVPPGKALPNRVVAAWHTEVAPVIAPGVGITVTMLVRAHAKGAIVT